MKNIIRKIKESGKGFTLIELLIVVGIIGILSTLLMANFIGVRQRARDAQRKSDLRQIQSALEIYRSDQSTYPTTLTCGGSLTGGTPSTTYMAKVPCDPSTGSSYSYTSTGATYTLYACLENSNDSQLDSTNKCSGTTYSFTVQNP